MIPYKDDNPTNTFPIFTVLFIALNCLAFGLQLFDKDSSMVFRYGAVPGSLLHTSPTPQPLPPTATVITSMFLHGGLLHLGGNMLYLWIFGNNIEDRLGHFRFVVFYLLGGAVAAYAHALSSPTSNIPMVGASGAIAAVLGAYILLYPRARIHTLLFLGFFVQVVKLPALIVIGIWAIIQVASGFMNSMAALAGTSQGQGGVAWFAHVGGFLFGLVSIKIFLMDKSVRRPEQW